MFYKFKVDVRDVKITYNTGGLVRVKVLERLCKYSGRNCVVVLQNIDKIMIAQGEKANKIKNMSKRKKPKNEEGS